MDRQGCQEAQEEIALLRGVGNFSEKALDFLFENQWLRMSACFCEWPATPAEAQIICVCDKERRKQRDG